MDILFLLFGTLLGVCVGSFCNVLIVRLHEGSSIGGRSRCVRCHQTLPWQHLIPLFSWVALGGRCAFCRRPIHWQYPVVEALGGVIGFVAVSSALIGDGDNVAKALFLPVFLFILLVIAAFDARWQLVPIGITIASAAILGAWNLVASGGALLASVFLGAAAAAVLLWLIVICSRGRLMGDGDPVVGFLLGAALGWPGVLVAIGAAFMVGGVYASILLILRRARRDTAIPFVPFLAIGAFVAYFWSGHVLTYLFYAFP